MVGPGQIVPQSLRAVSAHKDGTGVAEPGQIIKGLVHAKLQVLRGDLVGDVDGLAEIVSHDDLAITVNGGPGDFGTVQLRNLDFQLCLYRLCQLHRVGDQHGAGQLVVLCLGEQIGGNVAGVGFTVGDNEDLAGSGDHVDGHLAVDLLLGLGNKGVARAYDLIHPGDALGAVG